MTGHTTPPGIVRPWENIQKTTKISYSRQKTSNCSKVDINTTSLRCIASNKAKSKQSRSLSSKSVELMEIWYQQHADHPYPSTEVIAYVAQCGEITPKQVRKWMANKRVRAFNTLSYNQTVHPKRLKRLQRDSVTKPLHSLPRDHFYQSMKMLKSRMKHQHQHQPVADVHTILSQYATKPCLSGFTSLPMYCYELYAR